jgi:predicted TPR repeat methyltransferase
VEQLVEAGVKRISFASALYRAAITGLINAAREAKESGSFGYLGCGVGDVAAELAVRRAHAVGFDLNEELLSEARYRQLKGAEFRPTAFDLLHCHPERRLNLN